MWWEGKNYSPNLRPDDYVPNKSGSSSISAGVIIAIVMTIIGAGVFITICMCVVNKRRNRGVTSNVTVVQ